MLFRCKGNSLEYKQCVHFSFLQELLQYYTFLRGLSMVLTTEQHFALRVWIKVRISC